jgi:D-alanyl-D-alanine carboxypeptidase/D-alanyl-D-alanine-endopeptidase (penicillin-binding protein 4)
MKRLPPAARSRAAVARIAAIPFLVTVVLAALPTRAELAAGVSAVLRDKALAKGEAGVQIMRLDPEGKHEVLFRHNSDIPLLPASNLKLVTTAAFLDHFGPDFRFRTALASRADDLVLIGDGDPSFGDAEMLKRVKWESTTVFANWAQMLRQRGISAIDDVAVDDGIFDEQFVHPNWPAKQQHFRYVAGVAGVNFNVNALDFYLRTRQAGSTVTYTTDPPTDYANVTNECVSGGETSVWLSRTPGTNQIELKGRLSASLAQPVSVTIHDPAIYAGTVLTETLRAGGVTVSGPVSRDRDARRGGKGSLTVLAIHETPLATVLARANKDSVNVYAESMCKRLGADTSGGAAPGSWKTGTAAMATFVTEKCAVSRDEFVFDDGCGLSRQNRASANALTRVLGYSFSASEKNREMFLASLSVAGIDGTLDNRFKDSDLRGRVRAKSGFVNGVSSLSGYVHAKDGRWYAFSILMNGVTDVATCKQLQERIVKAIDNSLSLEVRGQG